MQEDCTTSSETIVLGSLFIFDARLQPHGKPHNRTDPVWHAIAEGATIAPS